MGPEQERNRQDGGNLVDLFAENMATSEAQSLRQREMLVSKAKQIEDLLEEIEELLRFDRERALALMAEATGMLEQAAEEIAIVRDVDPSFGVGRNASPVGGLALHLEKGVAYLLGIFSVATNGPEIPEFNWRLIERDVQEVLGTTKMVGNELDAMEFALAA